MFPSLFTESKKQCQECWGGSFLPCIIRQSSMEPFASLVNFSNPSFLFVSNLMAPDHQMCHGYLWKETGHECPITALGMCPPYNGQQLIRRRTCGALKKLRMFHANQSCSLKLNSISEQNKGLLSCLHCSSPFMKMGQPHTLLSKVENCWRFEKGFSTVAI